MVILLLIFVIAFSGAVQAQPLQIPTVNLQIGQEGDADNLVLSLQILLLLTVLTLAPAILIMMTAFTRIIIVLSMIRNALATQRIPPNQILVGLALFLTVFIMAPTFQEINQTALQPYLAGEIGQEEALTLAQQPLREFMFAQTREKDLGLFIEASGGPRPKNRDEVSTLTLIPAFVISELKTAFQIVFLIYLPFIVIDMVIASVLMSLGMMMLPPVMISLPFKLLLFVLVDGWYIIIKSLITTFS